MLKENPDRNFLIYELWKQGRTIDEISFETGIARSTVGYYIRKFNQCAKSGKPIPILHATDSQTEKNMAIDTFIKSYYSNALIKVLTEPDPPNLNEILAPDQLDLKKMMMEPDKLDRVYKALMILKLVKELTDPEKLNRIYKTLATVKLIKELQTVLFASPEELQAFSKNLNYVLEQITLSSKVAPSLLKLFYKQ